MPVATADLSTYAEQGYITLDWSALAAAGDYILTRSDDGGPANVLYQGAATSYVDWLAPSDTVLTYEVDRTGGASDGPFTLPAVSTDHYWLLHPTDSNLNLKLRGVTAETFSNEQEETVLNVIGRGRHIDYGTDYGETGSLTAQLREKPDQTAREAKEALRAIKDSQSWVWLRNPFGDMMKISIGQLSFTRVAGVGHREDSDVTIPYMEVA